jgi:preprotein translocase subunit SecY
MGKFLQIFKIPDLRKKVLSILFLLLVFRLAATIPIPGVDSVALKQLLNSNQLLGLLNIFSGGGLTNLSIIMLGVGPYITATIIMQLLTIVFPQLKKIYYEEGSEGQAKFNRMSRYLTVPLAMLQAYGFINLLISQRVLQHLNALLMLENVLTITAGSVFLMWIGELISDYKLGNGISLIIFAGIISRLPQEINSIFINYQPSQLPSYLAFLVVAILVIGGITFINESEKKIPISYAKQVRGMKMYGGASSYLPLKINQAGVIPIIFAISLLLFPQFFAQASAIFSKSLSITLTNWSNNFFNNIVLYSLLYFILVILFTYFYTAITFDANEIAKNLQKSGAFIPGIRPGDTTAQFIKKTMDRITLLGAIFLGIVAILPNILGIIMGNRSMSIGGTSILIVVAVALEVMKAVESQLTMREYEGIM